ncbi:hypothetical protein D3C85_1165610 [compost metagenome]
MVSRSAGYDVDVLNLFDTLFRQIQVLQHYLTAGLVNTSTDCITVSFRLFMDFFQHEMIKSVLFCCNSIPIDMNHFPRNKVPLNSHQFDRIFCQNGHFTIVKDIYVSCIFENSGNIRTDKVLPFSKSDNKRASLTYSYQFVRLILS